MQDVALFKEGFVASDEIKLMAEDGDNSGLLVSLLKSPLMFYLSLAVGFE